MKCHASFSLKKKREVKNKTPSHGFVFEALSDLVYCSCSQQIQCEGNCFILKDVKFIKKFYPLNLISMLKSKISLSIFTPSASISMLIFTKLHVRPAKTFAWSDQSSKDTLWIAKDPNVFRQTAKIHQQIWIHILIWVFAWLTRNLVENAGSLSNLNYSWIPVAWRSLGPWKFVQDIGCWSHWGLILVPGQEETAKIQENIFNFLPINGMLSVLIRIASILMSTHNIQIHVEIRKFPLIIFVFLSYLKNFVGTKKTSSN